MSVANRTSHSANQRARRRALFCTITQEPGHGGIARVSSLLWQVLRTRQTDSWELLIATATPASAITLREKMNFSIRVFWRQVRGNCDLIFFDHIGLARVQNLIPRFLRRPYGVFLHSIEAWKPLPQNRVRILANAKLRVANSHHTATRVAAAHPEIGEIQVCHLTLGLHVPELGLEPNACNSDAQEQILNQIRPESMLIVGRMMKEERHKGHDQLIRAWPLVRKAVPDAQLVIVGGGDDVTRLKELTQSLGVAGQVFFTGRVDDPTLNAIYERAAAFAMPSRAEGFGLVYLEAMAHRLACIGSIHDAAHEIIIDGETGFLVDQEDIENLASKIIQLLDDHKLRDRFGCRGFERLRTQFSFQCFENRIVEVLNCLDR